MAEILPPLEMEYERRRYPVATIAEARARWEHYRDSTGGGVSQIGNGVTLFQAGKPAAWLGTNATGHDAAFCDDCKQRGWERHGRTFRPIKET